MSYLHIIRDDTGADRLEVMQTASTALKPISLISGHRPTWLSNAEAETLALALLEVSGSTLVATASATLHITIGQHVRHRDYNGKRVTGIVRGIALDGDDVLMIDIALDAPIVIPARGDDDRPVSIWRQNVPAHELTAFDERDDLIERLQQQVRDLTAQVTPRGA